MTDKQKFEEFFKEMGVKHSVQKHDPQIHAANIEAKRELDEDNKEAEILSRSVFFISTAQAHFLFDKDEKYIGVQWDEMGYIDERVT